MGYQYFKRPVNAPSFAVSDGAANSISTSFCLDKTFAAATNGVKYGRLVKIKAGGVVVPTTGTSGRLGIGITLSSAASGANVRVRILGEVFAVASTAAIAIGSPVRGVTGASTGTAAGTVKLATGATASVVGIALSSVAAGAISTGRGVTVLLLHQGRALI